MKPSLKVKLELWENYGEYLQALPWWKKIIAKRLGYKLKFPTGAYDHQSNIILLFMDTAENSEVLRSFCHELVHASKIEKKNGPHRVDYQKIARLPARLRRFLLSILVSEQGEDV